MKRTRQSPPGALPSALLNTLCEYQSIQCVVTQNIYYDGRKISGSGTQSVYICDEYVTWYGIDRDNVPKDSSLWKTTPMVANRGRIEQASRWTVQEEAAAGELNLLLPPSSKLTGTARREILDQVRHEATTQRHLRQRSSRIYYIESDRSGLAWEVVGTHDLSDEENAYSCESRLLLDRKCRKLNDSATQITTTLDRPKQSHPEVDADMSAPEDDDQVQASEIDSFPAAGQNSM